MVRPMLTVAVLAVCVALSRQKKLAGARKECKSAHTSIAVMVDTSGSMDSYETQTTEVVENIFQTFEQMKADASSAGGSLDIAVGTFNNKISPKRYFGSSVSFKDTENELIHAVETESGSTDLPGAMKQIETFINGAKRGSFPAAILIADGGNSNDAARATAKRLRDREVLLHTIFIGPSGALQKDLEELAYNKTTSHNVADFSNANSAIKTLGVIFKKICDYVKEHTAPPPLRTTKRTTKKPTTTTTTTTTKQTTTTTTTPTTTTATTTTPEPTAQPVGDTPAAPEPTAQPAGDTPAAPEPTAQPGGDTPAAPEPTAPPAGDTPAAPEPTAQPAGDTPAAPEPTAQPAGDTPAAPEPTAQPAGDTPAAPDVTAVPPDNSKPCCANANGGNLLLAVVMGSLPNGKPLSLKVSNGEKSLEILAGGKNGTVRVAGTPELQMKP